jgi:antitoxin (DNA-binding transcriptional repressor) of toxin-antitoxin stability system
MIKTTIEVAETSLIDLLERTDRGEEVTITREGKAIALLTSSNSAASVENPATQVIDDQKFQELCSTYAAVA